MSRAHSVRCSPKLINSLPLCGRRIRKKAPTGHSSILPAGYGFIGLSFCIRPAVLFELGKQRKSIIVRLASKE